MRLGVISDTHGRIHPRVAEVFQGVDAILHAGDIGSEEVLLNLEKIAPVTAVAGNIDGFRCGKAGEFARFEHDGSSILLVHILDRPRAPRPEVEEQMKSATASAVVFGHSHLPHNEVIGGVLYFNPASAGARRFDYPTSVGFLEWKNGKWIGRHAALDERSEEALVRTMNQLSR